MFYTSFHCCICKVQHVLSCSVFEGLPFFRGKPPLFACLHLFMFIFKQQQWITKQKDANLARFKRENQVDFQSPQQSCPLIRCIKIQLDKQRQTVCTTHISRRCVTILLRKIWILGGQSFFEAGFLEQLSTLCNLWILQRKHGRGIMGVIGQTLLF